jgi:cytochrome P450
VTDARPGPPGHPVLGHLPAFRRNRLDLLNACAAMSGDLLELRLGRLAYLVKRAEDVHHVLVTAHGRYDKTPRVVGRRGRRVAGESVFTARAPDEHRRRRRRVQPAFRRESLSGTEAQFARGADAMLARWRDGQVVDPDREARQLALRNAIASLFGVESGPDFDTLARGFEVRRRAMSRALLSTLPVPGGAPLALAPGRRRALRQLDLVLERLVRDRRRARGGREDLLSLLARTHPGSGASLRGEVLTLAVNGYETVAGSIACAWREAASHPDVAEGLRAGGEAYATAVVEETLRLHPPTPVIIRVARRDDELPSGSRVRPGAKLLLSPYLLQRDPELHEEPERFDPSRFLRPRRLPHSHSHFPFGGGPRTCVGRGFAILETAIVIRRTVDRFDLCPDSPGLRVHERS